MTTSTAAAVAHFALVHVLGNPLVLPNFWDLCLILILNTSLEAPYPFKAVATASDAIATTLGYKHV